ncbi:MAG: hypothetical protein O2V44_07870 [Candidatus Bathyarchaeota archaeon]|nr:hypothetical protein [Candidatus Bathyarchaeota archaeon]
MNVIKPVQRSDAERYVQLSVLGLAASITLTRFILEATGYPQLGNETLHIAHCLYGGVILYIGCLLPLIYSNKWAFTWSGILSGAGMGLFIDEVGKFMTVNNDYFFPAAAPVIYGFFLLTVLLYISVAKKSDQSEEVIKSYTSLESVPEQEIQAHLEGFGYKWATQKRLKAILLAGLFLFGIGACVRLAYYYSGGAVLFETLLYSRISNLPNISSNAIFLATVQLWLEGLVGVLLLSSSIFLVLGKEKTGITFGSYGLIMSLVGVNLISFYIDQFGTIAKALTQYLILYILYYYQRRFTDV